jgi:hypothetical protein
MTQHSKENNSKGRGRFDGGGRLRRVKNSRSPATEIEMAILETENCEE